MSQKIYTDLDVNGNVKAIGFKTPSGVANQALTADGGVFDLRTKADLVDGKVPSSQLPSYVDDVLEFANLASFPSTGESGKIYIALDTNITYRWTGNGYAEISASLALGETSSTAYRGDRGKIAYDHSQVTHDKTLVGLGNVDNTSDVNKPISTATQTVLDTKFDKERLSPLYTNYIPFLHGSNYFFNSRFYIDTTTNYYVGLNKTNPTEYLDVNGNVKANGFKTHNGTSTQFLMADGSVSTLTNPITGTATSGQVAFFNGTTTQTGDNGLFWNNTNKRLGIGTNTPSTSLDVLGALTLRKTSENEQTILTINRFNSIPMYKLDISGLHEYELFLRDANNKNIITFQRSGAVIAQGSLYSNTELGIGRSIGGYLSKFLSTDAYGSFYELQTIIEGVGWGSLLQWDRNRTYFNILSNKVGIGTTSPAEKLDVNGRIKSKAIVLEENTETLPKQITYSNRKFYGTDSTGGKRMFQFADYQGWLDTVNGMTDTQKTEWKTAMNGGWTTNTMSVGAVSPKVVKNSNLPTYITIEGANLNLNPTNFSLKLVDAITGIETVVPNSQVQLQTNGLSLIFWFNFSTLPISEYYIRLDNGVAILTTNSVSSIMVRDTVQNIDLSLLTWSRVCVTPAEIDNTLITGVNSFIFRQNANNTPLVSNNASVIATAKSSQILSIGDNVVINGNIQIKAQNGVYNGLIIGLAQSSIATQLVNVTDVSIGFTADGSDWLYISKIINNVKSTLPSISLTSSTNLNLGFTIVKQGNVISITWRYTDQYNNTTSATVNKTITDNNYSLYLVGTSGNITGDNTIIVNDIYKF